VSYEWGEGTLSLPLYPIMTREDQNAVIRAVAEAVAPLTVDALAASE
jgi:dTDP-4-amino-4,6-dideoxygalactose transaminase